MAYGETLVSQCDPQGLHRVDVSSGGRESVGRRRRQAQEEVITSIV